MHTVAYRLRRQWLQIRIVGFIISRAGRSVSLRQPRPQTVVRAEVDCTRYGIAPIGLVPRPLKPSSARVTIPANCPPCGGQPQGARDKPDKCDSAPCAFNVSTVDRMQLKPAWSATCILRLHGGRSSMAPVRISHRCCGPNTAQSLEIKNSAESK